MSKSDKPTVGSQMKWLCSYRIASTHLGNGRLHPPCTPLFPRLCVPMSRPGISMAGAAVRGGEEPISWSPLPVTELEAGEETDVA